MSSARALLVIATLLVAACSRQTAPPSLDYRDGVVLASGWSGPAPEGGWEEVLVVRASEDEAAPPALGEYRESGGVIAFTPRFLPSAGVPLYVSFKPKSGEEIKRVFGEPAKAIAPTARVTRIYPSTDEWPANTLKMYVEFSAPMSAGQVYSHIRVFDDEGRAIENPFVEIEPELWDPAGRRITLLFDPGRIKRGLVDNETSGPPLVPGRLITIQVDPALRDSAGAPLAEKFSRTIRVTDPIRESVDAKTWRVDSPKSPTDDLVLTFPRPLDHALAQRAISVRRDGSPLAGKITLENDETRFRFTPASPWSSGRHVIHVDGVIEDLAGNRLGKVFDVDTSDPAQSTSAAASAVIEFDAPTR